MAKGGRAGRRRSAGRKSPHRAPAKGGRGSRAGGEGGLTGAEVASWGTGERWARRPPHGAPAKGAWGGNRHGWGRLGGAHHRPTRQRTLRAWRSSPDLKRVWGAGDKFS
jgi:hypothetical protein